MSDDLTPAEQARAARWAKEWLTDAGFDVSETARDAMSALSCHADKLDPPETVESLREQVDAEHAAWLSAENALHEANGSVESLRAEQDKVVAQFEMVLLERNKARKDVEYWQEQHLIVCDEAVGYKSERDEALAELAQRPSEGAVRILRASIEAIRDERDEAWRNGLRTAEKLCQANDDLEEANVTIARLRATHTEAEAARGRCARED